MLSRKEIENRLYSFEEDIFGGKPINTREFYLLKKILIDSKGKYNDLLQLFLILESMLDRNNNEIMNKRLNLLTIWSTIFLPLSFYTGVFGMNFDDVPFLTDKHGFWIFCSLTLVTTLVMWRFFKKNGWL